MFFVHQLLQLAIHWFYLHIYGVNVEFLHVKLLCPVIIILVLIEWLHNYLQYINVELHQSIYICSNRPKRPIESFTEFTEPESDIQINRQFMQGHNRLVGRI